MTPEVSGGRDFAGMVIVPSPEVARHVVAALRVYAREARRRDLTVPSAVDQLAADLAKWAMAGHHGPAVAGLESRSDARAMPFRRDPAAETVAAVTDSPDAPPDALLVTLPDAAKRLGVSLTGVKRLVASGDLRTVKVLGIRRIRVTDLQTYIDQLGGSGAAPASTSTTGAQPC